MTGYERYLEFNKVFPHMKETYKKFAQWYKDNKKTLPNGVYASDLAIPDIVHPEMVAFINFWDNEKIRDFIIADYCLGVPMYAAWRNSLSVYKIDEMIFDEMLKAPVPNDTPSRIFQNLPEFCVFVELPRVVNYSEFVTIDNELIDISINGFWAYLNKNINEKLELRICPFNLANKMLMKNAVIIDENMTVEQAIESTFTADVDMEIKELHKTITKHLLSILLWLCVEEPDVSNNKGDFIHTESRKKYTIHKKTGDFVPPSQPVIYHVGKRLGGEIREYRAKIAHDLKNNKGATKRPHIRAGHWHGYWYGSGADKEFKPKWLPAVFVNA